MNLQEFKEQLNALVEVQLADIMKDKPDGKEYLTYFDLMSITGKVRNVFRNHLGSVPAQIEVACKLSEVVLAPTTKEKMDQIKAAVAIGGGAAGIAMVIGGIGAALGFGAGAMAALYAFFVGVSLTGPIAIIAGGVALAGIAAYFALSGDEAKDTERAINALKGGLGQAVEAIWKEHGKKLGDIKKLGN